jgi:hypothetical protein
MSRSTEFLIIALFVALAFASVTALIVYAADAARVDRPAVEVQEAR